ncbi:hypothetical protein GWK47_000252 [Chionoecetes opilio]|uniref:Uncharacterized protein n=1 Tax=Chionoecetes opilio TaxID=41210 RepID=A0A8J8WE96_CHIOP|nr:hypothetical protein GWK47_000252 [Chionoecetes opilio]
MWVLVCDPNKLRRARQDAFPSARDLDQGKHQGTKIGLGYDGRKDKTRAMVPDIYGKTAPKVCSLLSSVNEMQSTQEFRGVPGGEDLTEIPEYISRWLTTAQSPRVHVDQKAWMTGKELNTLEILVKYCLQVYFKTLLRPSRFTTD